MNHRFKYVKSIKQVKKLIRYIKQTGTCSFDFETNGKPVYEDDSYLTIMGVSFQPGSAYVIPLWHDESWFDDRTCKRILKLFKRQVFENSDIDKVAFNLQFEYQWCLKYNIRLFGRLFDAMLAKYTLDEEKPNDLGSVTEMIFPEFAGFKDETEALAKAHGWAAIPLDKLSERNALDCDITLRLMYYFERKLMEHGFYKLYRNLLMSNVKVLAESSYRGIDVNREYLENLNNVYIKKLEDIKEALTSKKVFKKYELNRLKQVRKQLIKDTRREIKELLQEEETDGVNNSRKIKAREDKVSRYIAGEFTTKKERDLVAEFNFNSPVQFRDFLYFSKRGLRLPIIKYTTNKKTKITSNNPSTDEDTLLELKSKDKTGFIEAMLEWRSVAKLHSTYIAGMLEKLSDDDRIHTSFLIHGTVTGRLSSRNPNLQNIPRGTTAKDIKQMFIAPPHHLILELDYSQAELRLVAELAKDEAMIDIFKRGYNIHVATAVKANGYSLDDYEWIYPITKDESHKDHIFWVKEKKRAKLINFGILYGQTAWKLSAELSEAMGRKVSKDEAQDFIDEWYKGFPKVKKWIDRQHKRARRQGYVYNIFGRKRRLPNALFSGIREAQMYNMKGLYLEALRQSVNAPIQGGSSDMTQFSGILIRRGIITGELPRTLRQVYTVHDSLGYIIQPQFIHNTVPKLVDLCADPQTFEFFGFKLKHVNMKVSAEINNTWGGITDYNKDFDYHSITLAA